MWCSTIFRLSGSGSFVRFTRTISNKATFVSISRSFSPHPNTSDHNYARDSQSFYSRVKSLTQSLPHSLNIVDSAAAQQFDDLLQINRLDAKLKFLAHLARSNQSSRKQFSISMFQSIRFLLTDSQIESLESNQFIELIRFYALFGPQCRVTVQSPDVQLLINHLLKLDLEQISFDQLETLFHSCFRAKMKMNAAELTLKCSQLLSNKSKLPSSFLLAISKFLRLNDGHSEPLMVHLRDHLINNSDQLSFSQFVAFIAYFANSSVYEPDIFRQAEQLFEKVVDQMMEVNDPTKLYRSLRSKDVAKILWSMAYVNHRIANTGSLFPKIERLILRKLHSDFTEYPHHLLDCVKSMILLGYYPLSLISSAFLDSEYVHQLACSPRCKLRNDLFFVLSSLRIEQDPAWSTQFAALFALARAPAQRLQIELRKRPLYDSLRVYLQDKHHESADQMQIVYPLPHFNTSSLRVQRDAPGSRSTIYELIDGSNSIRMAGATRSNALFTTKIRQMRSLGFDVKVIDSRSLTTANKSSSLFSSSSSSSDN